MEMHFEPLKEHVMLFAPARALIFHAVSSSCAAWSKRVERGETGSFERGKRQLKATA